MKVIDNRSEVKEETYSIGDWFEYQDRAIQLIATGYRVVAFVNTNGGIWNNVNVGCVVAITKDEFKQLRPEVGRKVNVEIHIISNAE